MKEKIEEILSDILSEKYDCKVKIRLKEKESEEETK